MNIMQLPGDPDANQVVTARTMMRAAAAVDPDFEIMLMLDLSGSLRHRTQAQLAAFVAELAASPSAFRLADGRLVVSAFKAEAHDAGVVAGLPGHHAGRPRNAGGLRAHVRRRRAAARAVVRPDQPRDGHLGLAQPGVERRHRDLPHLAARSGRGGPRSRPAVDAAGVAAGRPPDAGSFDEAENTTNLRSTWKIARDAGPSGCRSRPGTTTRENTHLAPSVKHGWNYLDINAYYLTWYKTGRAPDVVRDTVYVTHRTQPHAASPAYAQTRTMALRGGSPARDTVEALTFLTAPGRVTVTVGDVATCATSRPARPPVSPRCAPARSVRWSRGAGARWPRSRPRTR